MCLMHIYFFMAFVVIWGGMCTHVPWCMREGETTAHGSRLSHSVCHVVPGIELRSSGLAASPLAL